MQFVLKFSLNTAFLLISEAFDARGMPRLKSYTVLRIGPIGGVLEGNFCLWRLNV